MYPVSNEKLFNYLKELSVIDKDVLDISLKKSNEENLFLGDILVRDSLIPELNLGQSIADIIQVPFVDLSTIVIKPEILSLIPSDIATKNMIIAFDRTNEELKVATYDPSNTDIVSFLSKKNKSKY